MALKDRLAELRRETGRADTASASGGGDIARRLQRLRPGQTPVGERSAGEARTGSTGLDPTQRDVHLAERLDGEVLTSGLILVERHVTLNGHHGARPLRSLDVTPEHLPEAAGYSPETLVFLDTETTGLSGGSGTVVFMLGLARLQANALVVRQYVLSAFGGEAAMLDAAGQWLRETDVLVSFNGKSFDGPLLAARCRLAGVKDRFNGRVHLDLLHPTRCAFARAWDDCRLATVERRLLDFHRRNDLPGSQAPAAWLEFIQRGEARSLPEVARHNHWDLVSLALLLPTLCEVYSDPAAWGADVARVARAHLRHGDEARARLLLAVHRDCLDEGALLELARLLRRAGAWADACAVWEWLAARGSVEARTHLAKYHEHVRRDPGTALRYCIDVPRDVSAERRYHRLHTKLAHQRGQVDCFALAQPRRGK